MENNKNIEMNMVRERSLKLPTVTDEMYKRCNQETREMIQEFFDSKPQLSPDTRKQYWSALKQFVYWVYTSCNDNHYKKLRKEILRDI